MDYKEPNVKIQCGIYKQEGHNHLKCPSIVKGQSSNTIEWMTLKIFD